MEKSVIIVDVQRGFMNDSTRHIPPLVELAQKNYNNVFITRFFNEKGSFYRTLLDWNRFDKHSDEFRLAFAPIRGATIIDKSIYSCVNSRFLTDLERRNITEIDICGVDTDQCVAKCAVDLFEAGIVPRVLAQLCASFAGNQYHRFGLKTIGRYIGQKQIIS